MAKQCNLPEKEGRYAVSTSPAHFLLAVGREQIRRGFRWAKQISTLVQLGLLLVGALLAQPVLAAEVEGDWRGTLQAAPTMQLRLVLHLDKGADGKLQGTLDSIDQNASAIAIADIAATAESLSFTVPAVSGRFEGRWDATRKRWVGQWIQLGRSMPLEFEAETLPAASTPVPSQLPANWAVPTGLALVKLIDDRIASRAGEGIAIAVVEQSGTRFVGRGPVGKPAFNERTIFEIGSMSKVFTALLLADMVHRAEIKLDDPAEKFLPAGSKMPERGGRRITLRDLATHRSGLPRLPDNMSYGDMDNPYADYDEAALLAFIARHQLGRDIGAQYEYSNLGMGLLGYLLARKSGGDFESLVKARITGPLGMADTGITLTPEQKRRFAQGHDMFMQPAKAWDLPALAGAGGLRSTAADMAKFLEAFIGLRPTPLAPAMQAMLAERSPAIGSQVDTGLGWMVAKTPAGDIVMHDGGTGGFRSSMAYDPVMQRGVIVLSNAAVEPSANDLAMHLLIGSLLFPVAPVPAAPPPARPKPPAITLPPAELDRVVGRYEFKPGVTLDVSRQGNGLIAQMSGAPKFPLFAEAPLKFFWTVVDANAQFSVDAVGIVTGVVLTQSGVVMTGKRVGFDQ